MRVWSIYLSIAFLSLATRVKAATGDLQATFGFHAERMLADPSGPYIYATVGSELKIINTNSLAVDASIALPSDADGMAMSSDGSKLYIAAPSAHQIFVLDTKTRTTLPSFSVDTNIYDLAMGPNNRLIAVGGLVVEQIDANTGTSAGPHILDNNSPGRMQISPDRNTLYFGGLYFSPGFLYKIDVSSVNAQVLWQTSTGANGHCLVLSHDGSMLAYVSGYGYQGYHIPDFSTPDMSVIGTFSDDDGYPLGLAYSPNDKYVYADFDLGYLGYDMTVYDGLTSQQLGHFALPDRAYELIADNSGQHLFVDFGDEPPFGVPQIRVYDTGVPEPSSLSLLIMGALSLRHRRPSRHAGI